MEIKKEMQENRVVLAPVGRIDTLTSGELEDAINESKAQCDNLLLDMAEVDYVSSAGIRVIISTHQSMGKEHFALKNVAKNVMQLLTMTGFDKVLQFED